ncbi:MAG: arsenic resistance N-acetyltransferase ArsN2 [Syntrophaceae bacterium]
MMISPDMKAYDLDFATTSDVIQINKLLLKCGLPWEDITLMHLRHFLVLKDDTGLIGVIGMEVFDRVALLRSLAVRTQDRNRGFASELIKKAEKYTQSIGIQELYLLTTTAVDFLDKRGYQRVDRSLAPVSLQGTGEFQNLCPSSAVCMVKYLREDHEGQHEQ